MSCPSNAHIGDQYSSAAYVAGIVDASLKVVICLPPGSATPGYSWPRLNIRAHRRHDAKKKGICHGFEACIFLKD